jgi:hypothetical protein
MEAAPKDWENPALTHRERLEAHASLTPFTDAGSAAGADRGSSPWFRLLNGMWRFCFVGRPEQAPAGFEQPDFSEDRDAWADITVPMSWQMAGYGRPQYTNVLYPFPLDPPRAPP